MNIQPLFSTPERERIMEHLLEHPSEEISMNALARKLRVSPGLVHKHVSLLRKNGLVRGRKLLDTPLVRALRVVDNLRRVEEAALPNILRKHLAAAKGFGMYGSWSNGSNSETADLDIWVKLEKEPKDSELAALRKRLEGALGVSVDVLIATPDRLEHLRAKSESLYYSLYNSILLWGEPL